MTMIKNIVFDMGGVLVDLSRERSVRQFEALGVSDASDLINPYSHNGLFGSLENGDVTTFEFCQRLSEHCGKELHPEAIREAWKSMVNPAPVYKLDYILELRKRYKCYVLSNNNDMIVEWAKTSDFSDARRPISDYFDRMYFSYELKCMKPHPEIFHKMIADSGIIPSESLYIDDGIQHLETAKSLGFVTLLAENGKDWRDAVDQCLQAHTP